MTSPLQSEAAAPQRSPRRTGRIIAITLGAVVLLSCGGYVAASASVPLAQPTVTLTGAEEQRFDAAVTVPQELVNAQNAPTAVGWLPGDEVWVNTEDAVPLASITKLVTALVTLEAEPVAPGAPGPVHVWTEADAARQEAYLADDGVAFPIPVGTEVTVQQMLTLALIPSANDFASAYAYSVFGDTTGFRTAVESWKQEHGLTSLMIFEPSGMDERNVASPRDVLQVTKLALAEPTIAGIVAQQSAELPWGIGTVTSTNPLFNVLTDVRGAKTGRTSAAGFNLAGAQGVSVGDRDLTALSVVLGRDTADARLADSVTVLSGMSEAPETVEVVPADEVVATITAIDGNTAQVLATEGAEATLVPGESATRLTRLDTVTFGGAGQSGGTVTVTSPAGEQTVQLVVDAALREPDLWWRLTHPQLVLLPLI